VKAKLRRSTTSQGRDRRTAVFNVQSAINNQHLDTSKHRERSIAFNQPAAALMKYAG